MRGFHTAPTQWKDDSPPVPPADPPAVGADAEALAEVRRLVRHAQFRWDYVLSSNGTGIHSPQEATRILGEAADLAQQARVLTARLLAAEGVTDAPAYPDVSTREKADAVMQAFVGGEPPELLP